MSVEGVSSRQFTEDDIQNLQGNVSDKRIYTSVLLHLYKLNSLEPEQYVEIKSKHLFEKEMHVYIGKTRDNLVRVVVEHRNKMFSYNESTVNACQLTISKKVNFTNLFQRIKKTRTWVIFNEVYQQIYDILEQRLTQDENNLHFEAEIEGKIYTFDIVPNHEGDHYLMLRTNDIIGEGKYAIQVKCERIDCFPSQQWLCKMPRDLKDSDLSFYEANLVKGAPSDVISVPIVSEFYRNERGGVQADLYSKYCEEGDLWSLLENPAIHLTEIDKYQILVDIAKALCYLHSRGIVHQDLNPTNILIYKSEGRRRAKICDFNLSCDLSRAKSFYHNVCATPTYESPEIAYAARANILKDSKNFLSESLASHYLNNFIPDSEEDYSLAHPANDMWAFGLIYSQVIYGGYPTLRALEQTNDVLFKHLLHSCRNNRLSAQDAFEKLNQSLDILNLGSSFGQTLCFSDLSSSSSELPSISTGIMEGQSGGNVHRTSPR